ncbi:hypothetical protein PFJ87_08g01120 [Encephalitozoon hellem]|uniref:Rad21/Rec8-like protein C-terminal eukaryotic domain-containing protein n=1 Tax=Encephalitozoon hellem TaxID=27973 RepID=A0ABY8CPR2_ENCHE|nr:hypothetical protein PFJ87_08g01120 [Encephalitozoon hellem]
MTLRSFFEDEEVSSLLGVVLRGSLGRGRKRLIEKIKICRIVEIMVSSVAVCDLRTSSMLLRAMARVYEGKVRICLLEVRLLVRTLSVTKKREKGKRTKGRNMLSMDTEHVSSIYGSEFGDWHYMDSMGASCSETLGLMDVYVRQPKRRFKDITDRATVLDISRMIVFRAPENEIVALGPGPSGECFVLAEARKVRPAPQSIGIEYSEMSTLGSIERPRNASVHTSRESTSSSDSDEKIADFSLDERFDKYIAGSRRGRAKAFYFVLEMCSRGVFAAVQKQAYGDIVLVKPRGDFGEVFD